MPLAIKGLFATRTITMEQTTIIDTVSKTTHATYPINDFWFWIAIVELLVLLTICVLLRTKHNKKRHKFDEIKNDIRKEGNIDFSNTLMSAFHSHELYDKLKIQCHPDRFPLDSEKNKIAVVIFQMIVENKNNYQKLLELKNEAENKLQISI